MFQVPPPSNLPPRPSVVTGIYAPSGSIPVFSFNLFNNPVPPILGPSVTHAPHMSPYHPHGQPPIAQTQQAPVERPPPMATSQYEDLSDSD